MIGLIQRVREAKVTIDQTTVGDIQHGILLLLGVEKDDNTAKAHRLLERVITYRIFEDDSGRMNRSLVDINGELLIVSQFTLPADTRKGTRPSFTPAAPPKLGKARYDDVLAQAQQQVQQQRIAKVASGQFGADMQVHLINDGPVTFWLQV